MSEVRVRIAPSPTGDPHVGTAYIGLFNLAFARHEGGKFILRIEDTDQSRSTKEYEAAIFRALRWVGLQYDEGPDVGGPYGPYRQSERSEIYKKYAQQLVDSGHAYYCFCTSERLEQMREEQRQKKQPPMYDGFCRELPPEEVKAKLEQGIPYVIRLKVPKEGETSYIDLIRKGGEPVVFQNAVLDDQVLMKSDGFPTYHLANVVDDHLMKVTHVIRAEEWVNSTPKHVLLYRAFGWEPPKFAHMPLLRNTDRSKISKRKNPTSLDWYREQGYLPEALLNFLALMGRSAEEGKEVFDLQAFINDFAWDKISTSAPIFDLQKLEWLNGIYIRNMTVEQLTERLRDYVPAEKLSGENTHKMISIIQERMKKLSDFDMWTWFFFTDELPYEPALLVAKKMTPEQTIDALKALDETYAAVSEWKSEELEKAGVALCEKLALKPGQLFMTLRVAITGSAASPPLWESMEILGKDRCMRRIKEAEAKLKL